MLHNHVTSKGLSRDACDLVGDKKRVWFRWKAGFSAYFRAFLSLEKNPFFFSALTSTFFSGFAALTGAAAGVFSVTVSSVAAVVGAEVAAASSVDAFFTSLVTFLTFLEPADAGIDSDSSTFRVLGSTSLTSLNSLMSSAFSGTTGAAVVVTSASLVADSSASWFKTLGSRVFTCLNASIFSASCGMTMPGSPKVVCLFSSEGKTVVLRSSLGSSTAFGSSTFGSSTFGSSADLPVTAATTPPRPTAPATAARPPASGIFDSVDDALTKSSG
ncbi:unnamed protein product [Kuraishia capsulata CBS 1993]|uniref:Uncharacterized protein n=1 Tax=Kuraishia capsulata CBS 1993 TaxID=1382522 RepID=W6MIC5_9ASCO|nr:uncharacterized protein KUCA_T00000052001 [Kuraishia capsulata CBS 1993]CDK24092.1 unnamed protein product [Kuraishia capsulata CBS 1993]